MGALGAFDSAVEFGRARRQDEEAKTPLLAGLFEQSLELAASVYLDGPDGKRGACQQGIEKQSGGRGGGATVNLTDVPTGDDIASGEVFQDQARNQPQFQGVHLDQIAGLGRLILLGFANGVGSRRTLAPGSGDPLREGLDQQTPPLQTAENPTDHGGGNPAALATEQDDQFVLAPARELAAELQDPLGQLCRPGGLASPVGATRLFFQSREVVRIVTPPPPVERLPADAEVPAGKGCVPIVLEIMGHPL